MAQKKSIKGQQPRIHSVFLKKQDLFLICQFCILHCAPVYIQVKVYQYTTYRVSGDISRLYAQISGRPSILKFNELVTTACLEQPLAFSGSNQTYVASVQRTPSADHSHQPLARLCLKYVQVSVDKRLRSQQDRDIFCFTQLNLTFTKTAWTS